MTTSELIEAKVTAEIGRKGTGTGGTGVVAQEGGLVKRNIVSISFSLWYFASVSNYSVGGRPIRSNHWQSERNGDVSFEIIHPKTN